MIFLSGAARSEIAGLRQDLGFMVTPQMGNFPDLSRTWHAFDTGCFQDKVKYDREKESRFLAKHRQTRRRCLFATAPDVWEDGAATLEAAAPELAMIREHGYPAAVVAQPGLTPAMLDAFGWDRFDCLFVGGPNDWHKSASVGALLKAARAHGKWLHRGRVNSLERVEESAVMGYDSTDGTFIKYGPDINLPRVLAWLDARLSRPLLIEMSA